MGDTEVEQLGGDELEAEITSLASHLAAAMCWWLLLVGEFDRRRGYERWEARSTAHWLNWRCGIGLGAGRDQVRVARRLVQLPLVREAFGAGTLSFSKVRAITRVATPETEATLVMWAEHSTASQLERIVRGHRRADRLDQPVDTKREVRWHYDDDGTFVVRARLSPEEGALLLAALNAARDSLENVSAETSPTTADAMVAIAHTTLAHGPTLADRADTHRVVIHLDVHNDQARTDNGVEIPSDTLRLVACDCSRYAVAGRAGEPLDIGRTSRQVTRAQRRALRARDGGCRFPGCTEKR